VGSDVAWTSRRVWSSSQDPHPRRAHHGSGPRSRQVVWSTIRELVGSGVTLFLTTQYLEEADALADHIVLIDHGRATAAGTSNDLKPHWRPARRRHRGRHFQSGHPGRGARRHVRTHVDRDGAWSRYRTHELSDLRRSRRRSRTAAWRSTRSPFAAPRSTTRSCLTGQTLTSDRKTTQKRWSDDHDH